MKKIVSFLVVLVLMLNLVGCARSYAYPTVFSREGVYPYEYSGDTQFVLQSFGMKDSTQIFTYKAPKEAVCFKIKVCRLNDDGVWECYKDGGVSINGDISDRLDGFVAIQLKDNYAIDFSIDSGANYSADEIKIDDEILQHATIFLEEHQDIELNTEIPVALMAYDSAEVVNELLYVTLDDYYDPSRLNLADKDLVQAVVFEFTDY